MLRNAFELMATEATLEEINGKTPSLATTVPENTSPGVPVRQVGEDITSCTFADVGSSLLTPDMVELTKGTGVGVSQASGNLLITTGTTTNAEYLARSVVSWKGSWLAKIKFIASQRIANQNFAVMLADLIGETLPVTINSATSITVTKVAHGYTATNVGQFMMIGGIVGAAGVPGRYAIASVPTADTINFTVAGWPASGSCTADVFGHSYVRNLYTGTTATNSLFDTQRKGWANGDTTATINTTASPGHVFQMHIDGRQVYASDYLVASTATPNATSRASKFENIPDDNLPLYLFIWSYNGTSAPASTTTWTIGFWSVEKYANTRVYIQGVAPQGTAPPLPVIFPSSQAVTASGTVTANGGTIANSTPITINSAATTNATSVKASAGNLYQITCSNAGAAAAFVKLYNKASAPTVGTDVPVLTIAVPASGFASPNLGPLGYRFATGIALAITNLVADSDTTAVAVNQVKVFGSYV